MKNEQVDVILTKMDELWNRLIGEAGLDFNSRQEWDEAIVEYKRLKSEAEACGLGFLDAHRIDFLDAPIFE